MKNCRKCGETKPLDAFYSIIGKKSLRLTEGKVYYLSYCKDCQKEYSKTHSTSRAQRRAQGGIAIERMRAADREYQRRKRLLFPEKKAEYVRKYYENREEVRKAHIIFKNAIRGGKIHRRPCRECGRIDSQGHHPDYSKPLHVIWLCPSHHKLEHLKLHVASPAVDKL